MRTVPPVAVPPPLAAGPSLSPALGDDAGVVQAANSSVRLARIGKVERVRRIGLGASRLTRRGEARGGTAASRAENGTSPRNRVNDARREQTDPCILGPP